MFDSMGAFTRQFTPVEGGYLYFPSGKGGGKLITADEYESLVGNWQRVAGRSGRWKSVGALVVALVLWTLASQSLGLSTWADNVVIAGLAMGLLAWILWASFAPRRLVRDRPAVAPPKPASKARREARAMISWQLVIFVLLASGAVSVATLSATPRTLASWVWLVGSGLMLGGYLWVAFQKLADRRR